MNPTVPVRLPKDVWDRIDAERVKSGHIPPPMAQVVRELIIDGLTWRERGRS